MKALVTFIALAALSACTNTEVLATCKGPIFALNTGHWQPTKADLQPPAAGKTP